MAGTDGEVEAGAPGWQWDVVLSFAGAQRDYVGQVAAALKARGVRCFYDADEQIGLWGKHLAEELPAIYGERAAAVVVFISAEYAARDWTRLERQAALVRAVRERREYVLPARFDDTVLAGLLSDVVTVNLRTRSPQQFAAMVADKLATLGIIAASAGQGDARVTRPPGAVRVAEADLRRLGVHAAISVPEIPDEVPPEYVPRDTDTDDHGVRAKVAAASERGGFVLLVGGSSVGKTRCAAEAARALLPDWWLVHPNGLGELSALAAAPPGRTVVWLDELQRYLDGDQGLTGGTVRALLGGPGLAVIIGTLWPDRYAAYAAVPAPGGPDPHAREREILDLAAVIRISPDFSPAEQGRARAAAARDRRLRVALEAAGYGLTQTLAAAPQLVTRWEDAQAADPYAWAVLTAALDAARLGTRAPVSAEFLRAAAPGYCTPRQRAEAPGNWFGQALAYATARLHGATAALAPAGADMGQVDGYSAADYLIQHATRQRRTAPVPASTWDALLAYVGDPADAARLADSARYRLLYCYAIPLYRRAANLGDGYATRELAGLLRERGDLDEAEQVLRIQAETGDQDAARRLARLLRERGDLDGLRTRADAGDGNAAWQLARPLRERGDLDEAEQVLRVQADAGDQDAAQELAALLRERGDVDGLRTRADASDWQAAWQLAGLLYERGDLDGLRTRADASDWQAARRLARLLRERGDLDGLRTRADAGDGNAAWQLAMLLRERGDLDEAVQILRARADVGDGNAARELARLLRERGDLDGLRTRANASDRHAAQELVRLLRERGDLDEAVQVLRARADAGDWQAARELAGLLREREDLDGLRAQADASDWQAARELAGLLYERGDLDEAEQVLRARADVGDEDSARELAGLLYERGDLDGLRAQVNVGDRHAAWLLAGLLRERGDLEGLCAQVNAGDQDAAEHLIALLAEQGRSEEAERLRQFGLNPDGSIASA